MLDSIQTVSLSIHIVLCSDGSFKNYQNTTKLSIEKLSMFTPGMQAHRCILCMAQQPVHTLLFNSKTHTHTRTQYVQTANRNAQTQQHEYSCQWNNQNKEANNNKK